MREREEDYSLDPVSIYLREAGQVPLLTREEEVELARRSIRGREAKAELEILENDGLRPEKKQELESLIDRGEEAKDRFVRSNTRLVISIAKYYRGRGMDFLDLIQEGNIGLMKAIDKFDPERGNRFSTFATWWIRQALSRAVAEQGRIIRIPMHRVELLGKIGRVRQSLTAKFSREPTMEEIAQELGERPEKIKKTLEYAALTVSLDRETKERGETTFGEMIEDGEASQPFQESEVKLLAEEMKRQIETLTKREREVIELRFGLRDGNSRTLEEVGNKIGLTRERVRQIQAEALRKFRYPARARGLRDYLEKG